MTQKIALVTLCLVLSALHSTSPRKLGEAMTLLARQKDMPSECALKAFSTWEARGDAGKLEFYTTTRNELLECAKKFNSKSSRRTAIQYLAQALEENHAAAKRRLEKDQRLAEQLARAERAPSPRPMSPGRRRPGSGAAVRTAARKQTRPQSPRIPTPPRRRPPSPTRLSDADRATVNWLHQELVGNYSQEPAIIMPETPEDFKERCILVDQLHAQLYGFAGNKEIDDLIVYIEGLQDGSALEARRKSELRSRSPRPHSRGPVRARVPMTAPLPVTYPAPAPTTALHNPTPQRRPSVKLTPLATPTTGALSRKHPPLLSAADAKKRAALKQYVTLLEEAKNEGDEALMRLKHSTSGPRHAVQRHFPETSLDDIVVIPDSHIAVSATNTDGKFTKMNEQLARIMAKRAELAAIEHRIQELHQERIRE